MSKSSDKRAKRELAAETERAKRIAAAEADARRHGGVVLGQRAVAAEAAGEAQMPSAAQLIAAAADRIQQLQAEVAAAQAVAMQVAVGLATMAELLIVLSPSFQRRPDGGYTIILDAERLAAAQGTEVEYQRREDGALVLGFTPPPASTKDSDAAPAADDTNTQQEG